MTFRVKVIIKNGVKIEFEFEKQQQIPYKK
jgi:hypothetical protein